MGVIGNLDKFKTFDKAIFNITRLTHSHRLACCIRRISPESIISCRRSFRWGDLLVKCHSPQKSH